MIQKKLSKHTITNSWQYNGRAPWFDIIDWCDQTLGQKNVHHHNEMIYFEHESDYALFLLKWS